MSWSVKDERIVCLKEAVDHLATAIPAAWRRDEDEVLRLQMLAIAALARAARFATQQGPIA